MVEKSRFDHKKGSFTVETAAVMTIVFFVLMASLYLCFFVHNRAWLTAAACEAALAGSLEAVKEDGKVYETTFNRGKELANMGFFGAENLTMQVHTGNKVSVSYNLETVENFGRLYWNLHVQGSAKVIEPVRRIRRIKAAADVIGAING